MGNEIKVLGLSASPRKGNSLYLLQEALEAAGEHQVAHVQITRYHLLPHKPVAPCDGCRAHTRLRGECRITDAFQEIRDLWVAADVVLYAFPVYHMGIPAQLKAFIDRLGNSLGYYFDSSGAEAYHLPRLMKVMGFITQGAHLFGGQELALSYMISHALLMRCIPVPGDLPNSYVGAAGWTGGQSDRHSLKELHDRCDRDAVVAVEAARQVARRSVEMAMIVREGLRANQPSLANYPDYRFVLDRLSDEVPQQGSPLG